MRPVFVAFFGVTFAVVFGVVWEIFEYAMDSLAPSLNKQSGETGVADTMQDLTVNALAAIATGFVGWLYLCRGAGERGGLVSFVVDGVRAVVRRNPWLFRRRR